MNKGTINQLFQSPATYRIPKLVTLVCASCVLLTMVSLDASASTSSAAGTSEAVLIHAVATTPGVTANPFSSHLVERNTGTAPTNSLTAAKPRKFTAKSLSSSTKLDPFSRAAGHHGQSGHAPTTTVTTSRFSTTTTSPPPVNKTTGSSPITRPPATTTTSAPPTTTTTSAPPTTTTTSAPPTTTTSPPPTTTTTGSSPNVAYPIGTADSSDQSGYSPPSASALRGYRQSYVTTFTGSSLPPNWFLYEGVPQGDSSGQFDRAHVTVSGGLLRINTYQDPNFNNEWVTGGTSLSGVPGQLYGAYFVRSRMTGPGPTGVELLWPDAPVWPPEIDFNETYGTTSSTSATVHYTSSNTQIPRSLNIDMTQWHTWGVIWTANSIIYTVDGSVWGSVTTPSAIPDTPMHISLQSQTWCSSGFACPTTPQSMEVDWVAQYQAN